MLAAGAIAALDCMHPTRSSGRGGETGKARFHEVLWVNAPRGHLDAVAASSDHPHPSSWGGWARVAGSDAETGQGRSPLHRHMRFVVGDDDAIPQECSSGSNERGERDHYDHVCRVPPNGPAFHAHRGAARTDGTVRSPGEMKVIGKVNGKYGYSGRVAWTEKCSRGAPRPTNRPQ